MSEKVVLEPAGLAPATVPEFLAVLRIVLEKSGLTAGQVAAKTSIARSSAYNLVARSRTALPVDEDQVWLFLGGCGLRVEQIDMLMRAWRRLAAERRRRSEATGFRSARAGTAARRREADVGVDGCIEGLQRARAAGDLADAVGWVRKLKRAVLAERADPGEIGVSRAKPG
ncbi:hypothetical protein [Amycolatopsis sp. NPDC051102]|uniref:hypothetical protein n=1 Tax=Amycolatopsis sp. NPDC051102 TaxID=3155163 RepID=UPI00341EB414